jgi:DNA-binding response OmpR family regulator
MRVLVVEDGESIRELIRAAHQAVGHAISMTSDSLEAWPSSPD